jgi:hypothetical protein
LIFTNTVFAASVGTTVILDTLGGYGASSVTFTVSGAHCVINGNRLSATAAATCTVNAESVGRDIGTVLGNPSFSVRATRVFEFSNAAAAQAATTPANQATLVISNTTLTALPGSTIALATTGGSGTGAVSYSVSGNGCSLSGSSLTATEITSCVVTATKAASSGFNAITSATKSFSFANANQATLSISNTTLRNLPGTTVSLTTTGGSGTGDVSFTVSGADCVITGASLVAATVTNCVVTAVKAASSGFNAATSAAKTFVYSLAEQAPLSVANSVFTGFTGTPISLTTRGGSGSGEVTFQVTGAGCSVSGNMLSATSATTCYVTAIKSGSAGFNPVGSGSASFTFTVPFVGPTVTSTFARKDSIKVDYIVEPGITYKVDVLDASGTAIGFLCGPLKTACTGSNTMSNLKPSTDYTFRLTATRGLESAVTLRPVTTYASITLFTSITSFTAAYDLVTVTFNPQPNWSYRLEPFNSCGVERSPYTSISPIVWTHISGWKCGGMYLTFTDGYGNTGSLQLPAPTLVDNALPSAQLVSLSPSTITGSGTAVVVVRLTDDVAVSDDRATTADKTGSLVTLKNAAGTEVMIAPRLTYQNGTNKEKLFATTFNFPVGFPPGTYTIFVRAVDWLGKTSTVAVGTITIN